MAEDKKPKNQYEAYLDMVKKYSGVDLRKRPDAQIVGPDGLVYTPYTEEELNERIERDKLSQQAYVEALKGEMPDVRADAHGVRADGREVREDGYVNALNKYGTQKDTVEHYFYEHEPPIPDMILADIYESNGLFARVIDAPAQDAVRKGFELEDVKDEELINFYKESLDNLDFEEMSQTALKWARLFGGSMIVMLINDGHGIDEPVEWAAIKSVDDMRVYDRSVLMPDISTMFFYSGGDPFRMRGSRLVTPEYYYVYSKYGYCKVHEDRVLIFKNGKLPEKVSNFQYELWGAPEFLRIQRELRNVQVANDNAVRFLEKSVQPIYKMKNLGEELGTEEGEDRLVKRLDAIDMAKGLLNTMAIDAEGESYEYATFAYNGVSDIINTTCNMLSAVTGIPQTILFGRSPAGMNSTGQSDLENYYNMIERIQKMNLRHNIRYLLRLIFQAGVNAGKIDEIPKLDVKFNSLWSLSEMEQADLDAKKAGVLSTKINTANTCIQMGVLDAMEVRKALAEEKEFDVETMLDEMPPEEVNTPPQQQEQGGDPMGGAPQQSAEDAAEATIDEINADYREAQERPAESSSRAINGASEEVGTIADVTEQPDAEGRAQTTSEGQVDEVNPIYNFSGRIEDYKTESPINFTNSTRGTASSQVGLNSVTAGNLSNIQKEYENLDEPKVNVKEVLDQITSAFLRANAEKVEPFPEPVVTDAEKKIRDIQEEYREEMEQHYTKVTNGEAYSHTFDDESAPSCGVVVLNRGRILTATREGDDGRGLLCGPGGHVEPGENSLTAALRETEEEFAIRPDYLIKIGRAKAGSNGLRPDIYVCTKYQGDIKVRPEELTNPKFYSMKELAEMGDRLYPAFRDGLTVFASWLNEEYRLEDDYDVNAPRDDLEDDYDRDERQDDEEETAPEEDTQAQGGNQGGNHGNTKLPYGLCKEAGIDTTGMEPHEAWEALKEGTGINPDDVYKEVTETGSVGGAKQQAAENFQGEDKPDGTPVTPSSREPQQTEQSGQLEQGGQAEQDKPKFSYADIASGKYDSITANEEHCVPGAYMEFSDEDFIPERKDEARWANSIEESKEMYGDWAREAFANASPIQRMTITDYTDNSNDFNMPLCGYEYEQKKFANKQEKWLEVVKPWDKEKYKGAGNADLGSKAFRIRQLTDFLAENVMMDDTWVQRGMNTDGVKALFGLDNLDYDALEKVVNEGQILHQQSFCSCGAAKGTGFGCHPVIMNIYCPAGTQGMWIAPGSAQGGMEDWNGKDKLYVGEENEMLLQRDTFFRPTKITRDEQTGQIFIDAEVVKQAPYDYKRRAE